MPEPSATLPTRIALWDNARWLLLVLVVWGHLLNDLPHGSSLQKWVALVIYTFHIPALIFTSGYFASTDPRKIARGVVRLLLTWLIFEAIWALVRLLVMGEPLSRSFLVIPGWTLWYLVTLATLMLLLPVIAMTRWPLAISVLISLGAGLLPSIGPQFSAARTAYLLPFFVLGWICRTRGTLNRAWFLAPSWKLRLTAAAAVVAYGSVTWWAAAPLEQHGARTWAAGYLSYAALLGDSTSPFWGLLVRAVLLVAAAVLSLAFLLIVSRRPSIVTVWGARTLYIYLLHTFVLRLILGAAWFEELSRSHRLTVAVTALLAVAIAVVLATAPVVRAFRPIIEPPVIRLLREDSVRG